MSLKNFLLSKVFLKNLGLAVVIVVGAIMILLIWLNLYTRHGQARPVPDFYGLSAQEVQQLAKQNKLRYQIIDSVYTTLVPKGAVAEQNPKPGFRVKKWRNIVLTINALNPEMVAMPNLVDLPIRQALKVIESSGLEKGELRFKPDLSVNVVIEQLYRGRPVNEGDSIQKGSIIDLVLGMGLSDQRTSVPNLIGLSLNPAKDRLMESALNLGTYIYDNSILTLHDTVNAFVFKQNPEFRLGASLPIGSDVYLWLTVDSAKMASDSSMAISDTIPSADISSRIP